MQTEFGDAFIMRNPGNFVPHVEDQSESKGESCLLEFGSQMKESLKHIVVCGHSDCRAMHAIFMKCKESTTSFTHDWVSSRGQVSFQYYSQLKKSNFKDPLVLTMDDDAQENSVTAYIDPENALDDVDKLSQINTLVQMRNVASYGFLREFQKHALWYSCTSGDFLFFSRKQQAFIPVNDHHFENLVEEVRL